MSSSSGTSRGTEFYEKAYMAGHVHFVAAKGVEEKAGHKEKGAIAMLHLHESLATICVAQDKEVVACYIEAVVAGQAGGSRLHMGQNRTWLKPAEDYVARILKILAKMSSETSTSSSSELELELKKEVYTYCKSKVVDRITKFEYAVDALVKRDDAWAKNALPEEKAKEIGNFVTKVKSLGKSEALSLSAKSEAFRGTAKSWGASGGVLALLRAQKKKNLNTIVEKRLLKVASYSRSIEVLSEWAKGAGEYKSLKKIYPVPTTGAVKYSKPAKNTPINPTSELWKTIATKYYAKDAKIDAIEELNQGIRKDANKPETQKHQGIRRDANEPKTQQHVCQIHAEMHIVKDLLALAKRPGEVYIGVSKLCCYLCYHCILAVETHHPDLHIHVKGTHNKLYSRWMYPLTHEQELVVLVSKLDGLNRQALKNPKETLKLIKEATQESRPVSSLPSSSEKRT